MGRHWRSIDVCQLDRRCPVGVKSGLGVLSAPMSGLPESGPQRLRLSRNGIYGTWADARTYSVLMLAAWITLAHFPVSSAMSFVKSAGEPARALPPDSAIRALIFGSARAALISLLSLSTISVGVPVGAPSPNQTLAS